MFLLKENNVYIYLSSKSLYYLYIQKIKQKTTKNLNYKENLNIRPIKIANDSKST